MSQVKFGVMVMASYINISNSNIEWKHGGTSEW